MARAHNINREASARGGRKAGPINGPIQGRVNAARPGHMDEIGRKGRHTRYHVNAGTSRPDCPFCGPPR